MAASSSSLNRRGFLASSAAVFQRLRQRRFGSAAQEARHPSAHRHRPYSTYLHEATVRFAAERGYEVTVVKDATADYSDEEMPAALEINIPNYASAIVTTDEIVDLISSVQTLEASAQ
jgi:hypothetical protein